LLLRASEYGEDNEMNVMQDIQNGYQPNDQEGVGFLHHAFFILALTRETGLRRICP